MTADEKPIRVVDDGLDTQHEAEFVVHLDPVFAEAVFDAHAFDAGLAVGEHLALEAARELLAQKAEQVLGAEAQQGVFDQFAVQGSERGAVAKEDVGGELGLIDRPVVTVRCQQGMEQGVDEAGEGFEQCGPVLPGKLIGEVLGPGRVGEVHEGVVELLEADVAAFHFPCEPLVAVDGDLKGEGKPTLQAHVDQPKLGMQEVVIQAEAFAAGRGEARAPVAPSELEGGAAFQFAEDADQAPGDLEFGGEAGGLLVLADAARQVAVGAVVLGGGRLGVENEAIGMGLDEAPEVLQPEPLRER